MKTQFTYHRFMKWDARCNAAIDGATCCSEKVETEVIDFPGIIEKGTEITLNGNELIVKKIKINADKLKKEGEMLVIAKCENKIEGYVNYYRYLRVFGRKTDGHTEIAYPTRVQDWLDDIIIMKNYDNYSDEKKEEIRNMHFKQFKDNIQVAMYD